MVIIALVVCAWAGWLVWSPFAARWMRAAAAFSATSVIGVSVYWVWRVEDLFVSRSGVSAADRQRALSEGFARAYTILFVVLAAVLVVMVALSVMVRSRRLRARDEGKKPIDDDVVPGAR